MSTITIEMEREIFDLLHGGQGSPEDKLKEYLSVDFRISDSVFAKVLLAAGEA